MIEINTNNQEQKDKLTAEVERLISQKKISQVYNEDDFYLVRTTDFIEQDHTIKPICNVPFITKNNNILESTINKILDEEKHLDYFQNTEEYLARKEMIKTDFLPFSSQYRSTVHFSINGLVSSHNKGNFDDRNFIIIDKFKPVIENNNLRSFRMEDTFFKGNVNLSKDATVLIEKSKYALLKEKYPQINSYNVVLFEGDPKIAVEMFLANSGIIPEVIEEHGAKENERSTMIRNCQNRVSEQYGIENNPHWLSTDYIEDDQNSLLIWDYYKKEFYSYLLSSSEIQEKDTIIESLLSDYMSDDEKQEILYNIIKSMGLSKYKEIINSFNEEILMSIKNKTFKTNNEIISGLKEYKEKNI